VAKWLVTGARGFLGTNAGIYLADRATTVGQARTAFTSPGYHQTYVLDLRHTSAVGDMVRAIRPDVVLHGAAISGHETAANDPDQAHAVNVLASAAIAHAAAEVGARVVYISTDALFSGTRGGYREDDPVEPFSVYGETKLAGEVAVRDALEDHLIVRTNFFGWSETGRKSILEFFVNSLRAGTPVRGYPDFVVTSIYVQRLLEAIWRLGEIGATGTVNVASSDALSKYDFGITVARTFGLSADLIASIGSSSDGHETSRSRDLSLNTDLAESLLGAPLQTQQGGITQARDDEVDLSPRLRGA